jgi:tetratricopeptide (TPR) repeat protein
VVALVLLGVGIFLAQRGGAEPMTEAQAQERLGRLAERFGAAIENRRDVSPLLPGVREVVEQHPDLRDGRTLLGQVYARLGQTDSAYAEFAASLRLDDNDPQLQNLAGSAALIIGDPAAAEAHHRRATQLAPDEPALWLALADVLLKQERWEDALAALRRSAELDMTQHPTTAALADVYAGRGAPGDLTRAIDHLERARAQVLNDPDGLEQQIVYVRKLARLYARRGEAGEALRTLESLMPDAGRARPAVQADSAEHAARWYLQRGEAQRAAAALDRLEQIGDRPNVLATLRAELAKLDPPRAD